MKKILCLLLCLLFMPWAVAEEMNADAEKWLKEKSLEMAALADDAMDSHAFTQAMMRKYFPFSDLPENVLAELRQVDFSAPVSMEIMLAPGIAAEEILQAMQPMMAEGDISPALADWIIRLVNGILPAGLLPADDFDFSLLSSAFRVGSAYICPDFITDSAWVTLEYDGDYMLLVIFDLLEDTGVISAGTTLLPADAMAGLDAALEEMRHMIMGGESDTPYLPESEAESTVPLEGLQEMLEQYGIPLEITGDEGNTVSGNGYTFSSFVLEDDGIHITAYIPNFSQSTSQWIDERVDEMTGLMNEALGNFAYLSLLNIPAGARETLAAMQKIDFSVPNANSRMQDEPLFRMEIGPWMEQMLKAADTSDALYQSLMQQLNASVSENIYAQYSKDVRALFESLCLEKIYIAPEDMRADEDVLLFYEGDFALWISFRVLEGGIVMVKACPADRSAFEAVIKNHDLHFSFEE